MLQMVSIRGHRIFHLGHRPALAPGRWPAVRLHVASASSLRFWIALTPRDARVDSDSSTFAMLAVDTPVPPDR